MNYLAHACLSFDDPGILAGNMIGDFVKGRKKFDYPDEVRKGIELHRAIDEFTDSHPATREAKVFFKPAYGLYAGAFMDIVYDHFLALDPDEFPAGTLSVFAETVYRRLSVYEPVFPEKFVRLLYYMRTQNWLYNYQFRPGACKGFGGLVQRALYLHEHQTACKILEDHYTELGNSYRDFFPAVKIFARNRLKEL
jgi:acyl carrier protein phosphodiesterase